MYLAVVRNDTKLKTHNLILNHIKNPNSREYIPQDRVNTQLAEAVPTSHKLDGISQSEKADRAIQSVR